MVVYNIQGVPEGPLRTALLERVTRAVGPPGGAGKWPEISEFFERSRVLENATGELHALAAAAALLNNRMAQGGNAFRHLQVRFPSRGCDWSHSVEDSH
jgi:hypothetical protein